MANSGLTELTEALREAHPCEHDNACDVAAATRDGFPRIAYHLLASSGAIEDDERIHELAVVSLAVETNMYELPEWQDWADWFTENTVECDCGAYVWLYDETESECSDCLAHVEA